MKMLKRILAQEDTVLFVGSGISLWSGLPTWRGMIEELTQFVEQSGANTELIRAEANKGDLLQAASYGMDKLTKQQIGEFIRSACLYGLAKPHEIHRKIVSLGPRCFITTNYDDLIEQSLRKWQPDRFYPPPVSNRQLTEMAGIVHARAIDFIFKPHGDAADTESIILTREQYRQLLPQGERHAALESVKMLLASRPVLYLGFGLRDPDFIYIRDLLANTYKGGTRDHYAIMADISEPEIDYWRRNYGIHLYSYATTENADKSKDHSELLALLDTLVKEPQVGAEPSGINPKSPDVLLALARHAAALSRTPKLNPEFPIRVHSATRSGNSLWSTANRFDHSPVEKFLDAGPERALLIGLPGAGKTYSLRQAVARLADQLHQICLAETFDDSAVVVPIFADLKLYRGDLSQLISQTLSSSLPLEELIRVFKVRVFLDSFNEMPREFWESGAYESDFVKFSKELGSGALIIGSRTSDGLAKLELPTYLLDEIEEETVLSELTRRGIAFTGRFSRELHGLLQRPFYFRYVVSGAIGLAAEAQPRDFYRCFFENASNAFASRFSRQMDVERALSTVAYEALNRGEEAFPLSELIGALKATIDVMGSDRVNPNDVANWLVSESIIIPHTGRRIAFVHQSVTEYLAATELARRYLINQKILKEKLTLTRWDQALFLTLSLLPPVEAESFLNSVIQADFALALNAAKYLEMQRDEVIAMLLAQIPKRKIKNFDHQIESAIEFTLPITAAHESHLRAIIACGNMLGGAALTRLVSLRGNEIKEEFLPLLVERRDDYNFCRNGLAPAFRPYVSGEDAGRLALWADQIEATTNPSADNNEYDGFISGAAHLLAKLDLDVIRREFLPTDGTTIPTLRGKVVCEILMEHSDHHASTALPLAADLLLKGVPEATTAIYFVAKFSTRKLSLTWDCFTSLHIARLEEMLVEKDEESWPLDALQCICEVRQDLRNLVAQAALQKAGIEKATLLYCIDPKDMNPVFQALGELLSMDEEQRKAVAFGGLKRIEFNWAGKEQLFVDLLRLRDADLAVALFGGSCPPNVPNLGILDIGSLDSWLDWMLEVGHAENQQWFLLQMGALLAEHLNRDVLGQVLAEFNRADSKFRRLLLHFVIPHMNEITTEAFSEDTISFLLADLSREGGVESFQGHLLGKTATERFILERLLPLLSGANSPFAENLRAVLKHAGSRHGRRYVVDEQN